MTGVQTCALPIYLGQLEKGSASLRIRIRNEINLNAILASVQGVHGIEGQGLNWEIKFNGDDQVHDEILYKLVQSKVGLIEFLPKKMDLEDVFLKLTYGQEAQT